MTIYTCKKCYVKTDGVGKIKQKETDGVVWMKCYNCGKRRPHSVTEKK